MVWTNNAIGETHNALSGAEGRYVTLVEGVPKREHFVFLIDTSRSMRRGGVAYQFADLHEALLDTLADGHPGAVVSCLTFNEQPHVQYVANPVEVAPRLRMVAKYGNDLPVAICSCLVPTANEFLNRDDMTVIIVTDGDTESHTGLSSQYEARRAISRLKAYGTKFLCLVAGANGCPPPVDSSEQIGLCEDEIMSWEHTVQSLSQAFGKVGEKLALGAARSTNDRS